MRPWLAAGLCLCVACEPTSTETTPECSADTDCDPAQICGEQGVVGQVAGECMWVNGHTVAIDFISAEVSGGASEDGDGTTWDIVVAGSSDGSADLQAAASQGTGEIVACTGYVEDHATVTFADVPAVGIQPCQFIVYPGQPLTLYLLDHDNPGDGGGEHDIIDSWTWEGEVGYAELMRDPPTKRLEGTWSAMFITVYDI